MDFEKYFEQLGNSLQKELENSIGQDMQMFCPYCGEEILSGSVFCPYCGEDLAIEKSKEEKPVSKPIEQPKSNYRPLYKLPFFEGLEEDTKTKIRTFEHIYQKAYEEETKRPLVSVLGDKIIKEDFAPLIISLSSALEIEMKKSVLPLMRNYGKKIKYKDLELELEKQLYLRDYQFCFSYDCCHKNYLKNYGFHKGKECAKALNRIRKIRNKSAHGNVVYSKSFYVFYDNVYDFFQMYMEDLIKVKILCKNKSKASTLNIHPSFFCNNQQAIKQEEEKKQIFTPIYKKGIILTDTRKIAHKFFDSETTLWNGELVSSQQLVVNVLKEYIQDMASVGITYELLDISHYADVEQGKWQSYARCLDNYRNRKYPQTNNEKMGLFIIGGNDVVPMPQIVNPFFIEGLYDENERVMEAIAELGGLVSDRTLDTDMLYAYANKHTCIVDYNNKVDYDILLKLEPLFWVGRLPMEEGVVSSLNSEKEPLQEFINYFTRSFATYAESILYDGRLGINVNKHIMTACESTQIATEKILEGLPFTTQTAKKGCIQSKEYFSPNLNLEIPNRISNDYMTDIKEADILTFFLHGNNKPSSHHYYGENKDRTNCEYKAFEPNLLLDSNAKIISGICCWGARFIGYPKIQSTLLTAMYSNTLLFLGASRCAAGVFDDVLSNVPNTDIAYAELLLKYYLNYLLQGYDAGEALGRAKMDYIQTEKYSRMDALATMLEFNLFGDPLLSVQPILDKKPVAIKNEKNVSWASCGQFRIYQQVFDSKKTNSDSILDKVRGLVDRRLSDIRQKVTEQLYKKFNINPQSLSAIHSFHTGNGEEGYRFCFNEINECYNNKRVVDTDKNGNVIFIFGFFN